MFTNVSSCIFSSWPNVVGVTANVLEIPSVAYLYGNLATDNSDAKAPVVSAPYAGLAPGANGSPFWRPFGVVPVFLP